MSLSGPNFKIEKPYCGEKLSDIGDFDVLILMGGPQSALRVAEFPYLQPEIALIRAAFSNNKKILGFCLGAQSGDRLVKNEAVQGKRLIQDCVWMTSLRLCTDLSTGIGE